MNTTERISGLIRDHRVRWLLLSAIVMVLMSFYRAYAAGTIRVDAHGLSGIPVLVVFTGFCAGLLVYAINLYRIWDSGDLDIDSVRILSFILAVIFSLMLPMLSNDIFSLLTYGDAANRGVDVYTDIGSLSVSPFFDYVSYLWKTAPCVYGPVSLGTSQMACMFAGGYIGVAIAAYKLLTFAWAIILIQMAYRTAKLLNTGVKPFIFIVLNPVFLLQGLAQLHCDMLAITFCACTLYFLFRRNWYLAFLLAGFTIAAKMNFILIMGFIVIYLFLERESTISFMYKTLCGLWITGMVLFMLYFPYYTSPQTFIKPFNFLFNQPPAKSLAEVIGDIVYFAPSVISGHNSELNSTVTVNKAIVVSDPQMATWIAVKKVSQLFAILMGAFIFIKFWMGKKDRAQWMKVFLRLLLVFLLFYSHVFYAWYLMILLPFVWHEDDKRFIQWLFVLTCFSNVHDIMCAVNRGTAVYFLVLPLTLLSVLVFFWRFRNNFFRSLIWMR